MIEYDLIQVKNTDFLQIIYIIKISILVRKAKVFVLLSSLKASSKSFGIDKVFRTL